MIRIENGPDCYFLVVGDFAVCSSICHCHLKRTLEHFLTLPQRSYREAMHFLTTELGFCETAAKHIMNALHSPSDDEQPRRMN